MSSSQILGFECPDCQTKFDTKAKLKYHKLKTHGKWKEGFSCDQCPKHFGSQSNLRRHLKTAHGASEGSSSIKSCPQCDYTAFDQSIMTVHIRKHTGERPFKCSKCSFGFYKNSDLSLHTKTCTGVKHQCPQCQEVFHFKKQYQEHVLWSPMCGKIIQECGPWPIQSEPGERYLKNKPSMVRFNLSQSKSVVVLNYENAIDEATCTKRKKKSRCGLCTACEIDTDCGTCKNCLHPTKGRICEAKACINRIDHYDVKKSKSQGKFNEDESGVVELALLQFCPPNVGDDHLIVQGVDAAQSIETEEALHFIKDEGALQFIKPEEAEKTLQFIKAEEALQFIEAEQVLHSIETKQVL